jgi:deoxycytidylate deaminase
MTDRFPPPLNVAIKLAANSTYKHRLGAVVVKQKKIIGRGWNSIRHHKWSKYYEYSCSCHAESAALLDCSATLRGFHLYVARINKDCSPRLSRPCQSCLRIMRDMGGKQVTYTTNPFENNDGFATIKL